MKVLKSIFDLSDADIRELYDGFDSRSSLMSCLLPTSRVDVE